MVGTRHSVDPGRSRTRHNNDSIDSGFYYRIHDLVFLKSLLVSLTFKFWLVKELDPLLKSLLVSQTFSIIFEVWCLSARTLMITLIHEFISWEEIYMLLFDAVAIHFLRFHRETWVIWNQTLFDFLHVNEEEEELTNIILNLQNH